ncbi:MAG: formate/nitrite transporter family protein [Cellulosilyticaceae bacterium]
MSKNYLAPNEITDYTIEGGYSKINRRFMAVFLMAVMAGIYVALGGLASSTAAHAIANKGVAKLVTGAVFPIGLMFVVINGADLFTGNCLIVMAACEKRVSILDFFKNLVIVLAGNFVGAVFIAYLEANSGIFSMSDNGFGAYVLKTAVSKVNLSFKEALFLAIICNIFVCAGIVMIYAAKDITGKILAGFFSIFAFAISGAEHIVANMYYIPAAIFSKANPDFIEAAHLTAEQVDSLTWGNFFIKNAIPVTLGNLLGGIFIGLMYYIIYKKCSNPITK